MSFTIRVSIEEGRRDSLAEDDEEKRTELAEKEDEVEA